MARSAKNRARRSAARPGDLVLVNWVDSGSAAGWLSLEQIMKLPTYCRSVGWIQKRDRLGLYLAACTNDCEGMNRSEASFIPAGCVQKITVIRPYGRPSGRRAK